MARSGHVTCNLWGWIHLYGIGELAEIEGRFTADQYLEILEEVMLPTVHASALPYPEHILYIHDNCSIHTANCVRRWFADQQDLELLPWPSKGCDINPIENIWACIVNAWDQQEERTSEEVRRHAETEWEILRGKPNIVYNHVASVSERLRSVIENNGTWTKY